MTAPPSKHINEIAVGYLAKAPIREVVPPHPDFSVRWSAHGYPHPLARWNFHPEFEIHLITASTGRWIIGNEIGTFTPGHLVIVGPHVPHDWISDIRDGEYVPNRDIVLHFREEWITCCMEVMPELHDLKSLLQNASKGIEFFGKTAMNATRELLAIGASAGTERIQHIFALLNILNTAPEEEHAMILQRELPLIHNAEAAVVVNTAIEYIFANISGTIRISKAAALAGMSQSAFSRFFKAASGHTFTDMVRKLRLTEACRLLEYTNKPIASIAREVGYTNLSNFNRQFKANYKQTPSDYRSLNHFRN